MKYYLGIDAGGTKTAFLLAGEDGRAAAEAVLGGCSYKEIGTGGVGKLLREGMESVLKQAGISFGQIVCTAVGLPCYGESLQGDQALEAEVRHVFAGGDYLLANDVRVGWAGSLDMQPGIHVVAGTGSIVYGENAQGVSARSGGWSTFFGDEGSCYWLGRRTAELFFKEADGRIARGALHKLVWERLGLERLTDAVDILEAEYAPHRDQVASLQRILLEAARAGDLAAACLYKEAAEELFLMIESTARALDLGGEPFAVSYSGGLFHAGEFVLPVLERKVSGIGGYLKKPSHDPVWGAVQLARKGR